MGISTISCISEKRVQARVSPCIACFFVYLLFPFFFHTSLVSSFLMVLALIIKVDEKKDCHLRSMYCNVVCYAHRYCVIVYRKLCHAIFHKKWYVIATYLYTSYNVINFILSAICIYNLGENNVECRLQSGTRKIMILKNDAITTY